MKLYTLKPLLAALLLAGSCAAQAAHFEVVGYQAAGGYSGELASEPFSHDASNISQDGDVSFLGAYQTPDASHGYTADTYLQSGGNLWMSATQHVDAGLAYSGDAFLSVPQITLKIVGDGEALGSAVRVSFSGLANAFNNYAGTTGMLTMDMAVTSGNATLGSFLWDASADGAAVQNVSFNFLSNIGDTVTFSSNISSSLLADGSQAELASVAGSLDGNFAIAAVPEPEQYAMLLAGLGLMGVVARRRSSR